MPDIELKLMPNWTTIIVQLISTGILLLIFRKFAWKYVLNFLHKRADAIEKNINDAQTMRDQAQTYLDESEKQARESAKQYHDIIDMAKDDANKEKQRIMDSANEQARKKIAQAEEEIAAEKAQARSEMKGEIVDIATQVAEKIMNKQMDAATNDEMVKDFVDKVVN
jgi:F-type H+-transporting ATPase subunit b